MPTYEDFILTQTKNNEVKHLFTSYLITLLQNPSTSLSAECLNGV